MKEKGFLYLFVIIIGIIIYLVSSGINFLSGCNEQLLNKFTTLDLAKQYQEGYLNMTRNQWSSVTIDSYNWYIDKYGDNCKVQFRVSARPFSGPKTTIYSGDEFLINLSELKVYPITTGAKDFILYGNFNLNLR